jgi:hypothetical protein
MEPKRLTDDELAAIRARAEAATPGRWNRPYDALIDMQLEARLVVGNVAGYEIAICENRADAEFIAHARADIPALLAHADALAAENARLRGERRVMHDVLLTLVSHIHMRAHPSNRTKWVCPYCKGTHKSLTALEEGEGHTENCPYAAARALLEGGA